jgi:hypothetical protein
VDIFSSGDGIQAALSYQQTGGTVTVRTGGYGTYPHTVGSTLAAATSSEGIKCEHELLVKGGTLWVMAEEDALKANGGTVTESGIAGKGTVHLSGGYVFAASDDSVISADGNFTVSSAYLVMEALADEGLTDVVGTSTYMTSTVLFLGTPDTPPTSALTLEGITLSTDTYTVASGDKEQLVFTSHRPCTALHILTVTPLADGEYTRLEESVSRFTEAFEYQWNKENKPYGLEVHQYRLGGLVARIKACKKRIYQYLNGEISEIPELLEEILPFLAEGESGYFNNFASNVSANIM